MKHKSTNQTTNSPIQTLQFHDALDDFPFFDASDTFDDPDDDVITSVTPESPSSAGLRRRKPRRTLNNPDGSTLESKQSKIIVNNKTNKVNDISVSNTVNRSLSSDRSIVTSANESNRVELADTANSVPCESSFMHLLVELVIKVISFQTRYLASSVTFPIHVIYSLYTLVIDPSAIFKIARSYVFGDVVGNVSGVWEICRSGLKLFSYVLFGKDESVWNVCWKVGKGVLWLVYVCFVLVALLVPAVFVSGVVVKWIVEEPVVIMEELTFDYTRDSPVAFVPIMSCMELGDGKSESGRFGVSRVVPFGHELQATVSLMLPESDYNRNLGIFQVRVDYLSRDGKALASTRQPSMLQFKSQPIRLLSTFFKLVSILTGYSSETQTLDIKFRGYKEKYVPTSCSRVVIEQRAEFPRGGGVPEIYSASLKLESQLPFLKRMLWYWKGLIYIWICGTMFVMELVFTLLCCIPVIFPGVRRGGGSSNSNASRNTPPGRS